MSKQIQVLMDKGLNVWKVQEVPKWQMIIDKESTTHNRAICSAPGEQIMLGSDIVTKQLLTTVSTSSAIMADEEISKLPKNRVDIKEFDPPINVRVINLHSSSNQYVSVSELFADVFSEPCETILINDPYLIDRKSIFLLEPYLEMAIKNGSLNSVIVHTKKSVQYQEQLDAEKSINQKFNNLIVFKHNPIEHDRYIELTRKDGERARIILGRGLDFMQSDGSIKSTFIIIQDPISS